MTNTKVNRNLNRRDFLKLLAVSGVVGAGGYVLSEYTPWLDYDEQVKQTWAPLETGSSMTILRTELVRYATLAANGHNTQPWKFAISENAIEIHPDYSRGLAVVDPEHCELWISLGCALENLLIAARANGFAPEVIYPDSTDFIRVALTSDTPQSTSLFDAIPLRQNTRSEYNGELIPLNVLDQAQTFPLEPGISTHFITTSGGLETVLEYVNQANLAQYADQNFLDELIYWLRFNKKAALSAMDGLYARCSGNPEVPHWLGQMFVAGTKPQQQADADAKKLRSSAGALVIASDAEDKTSWVRTGQVYERMALQLTSIGIRSAFLNQPIEVKEVRSQFQSALGLGAFAPQLLMRFGYAEPLPFSLRRPVEEILI